MKRILCFILVFVIAIFVSGCEFDFYEEFSDFNVSEIIEVAESQITLPEVEYKPPYTEISYDDPFVYNTYYDSGYTALNEKQRSIYETLYLIALQMPLGYVRLCDIYDNYYSDTGIAYNAMINDHPDFFWMPYTYVIGEFTDVTGSYICIAFEINDKEHQNEYLVSEENRNIMRQQLNKKIEEIVSESSQYKGEYQKAEFFNNYLCDNTEYDEYADLCQTTYGCLINGKALCEGYSRAFKLLCNQVGIRCDLIYGRSDNEDHMWNCVNIGGYYSYTDVTWNDGGEEFRYIYFNITDSQLLVDRSVYPYFADVAADSLGNSALVNFVKHTCDYTGNSYYMKNGLVLNSNTTAKIAQKIMAQAQNGAYSIQILATEDILNRINSGDTSDLSEIQKALRGVSIEEYSVVRDILTLFLKSFD